MPKYRIELSDGRKFDIEADSQPSEADVLKALGVSAPSAPSSTAKPIDPNEPDTYLGGFTKSLGQTAYDTGHGIVSGVASLFNPLTYLGAMQQKDAAEQKMLDEVTGKSKPAGDYGMGTVKTLVKQASDPYEGGKMIGQLAAGEWLVPPAAEGAAYLARGGAVRTARSALKPSNTLLNETKATDLGVQTKNDIARRVLDTPGAYPTEQGVAKAQAAVDAADQRLADSIKGGQGNTATVVKAVDELLGANSPYAQQANPQADLATIRNVRENFVNHPQYIQPTSGAQAGRMMAAGVSPTNVPPYSLPDQMPLEQMLAAKKATGQTMAGRTMGELPSAQTAAERALYRGFGNAIEESSPGARDLSQQVAQRITVRDALENALNREGNKDVIGFANVATTSPRRMLTALADRNALVKMGMARLLNGPTRAALAASPDAIRAAILQRLTSSQYPGQDQ